MSTIRVRFAPSPTGFLHIGGARTALFNYYFARHFGGTFVLRIEDTDVERSTKEFEKEILESMQWLGMHWDEGPFYQAQRLDLYRTWVNKLLERGGAYRCTCTTADVDKMREVAQVKGEKPMYDRRCREKHLPHTDAPYVVRFKTPLSGDVGVDDLIKGKVSVQCSEIDDFVILRSSQDGQPPSPMYNFAVVVDDIDMKITHVIRGDEHLNNAYKQILIMQSLGHTPPQYAHVPIILAPDRSKLSKRHGATAVTQYSRDGYLPEAIRNYLIRLGWSHGDQEIFSHEELKSIFDIGGCGDSPSIFDTKKLDWYNAHYIRSVGKDRIVQALKAQLDVDLGTAFDGPSGEKLFKALADRATTLKDFAGGMTWIKDDFPKDAAAVESVLKPAHPQAMADLRGTLANLSEGDFVAEKIFATFKDVAAKLGLKMHEVAKPARVLLTGSLNSPDIGLVAEVLGKARTLQRLIL